jgi:hypothetical protein
MVKKTKTILASTSKSLARAKHDEQDWVVTHPLENLKINRMISDPTQHERFYLATQHQGVLLSEDAGITWQERGLAGIPVKSLAIDPHNPRTLYAGGKPVSLYVTHDGGQSWAELPALRQTRRWWWFSPGDPPGMMPYVNDLSVSPENPQVILAGIEAGAVLRSEDGGKSWTKHLRGADRDPHSLKFHPSDGKWVYEAGGVRGPAFSQDGGKTWRKPLEGLGPKYGWRVAADPLQPEIWYLSASEQPKLLRGEFAPPGHQDGQARAHIYRKNGAAPWVQLSGGLPEPLDYMAYDLATVPDEPGGLYAGLANGEVWHSGDYGDTWACLPFNLGRIGAAMVVI